MEMDLKTLLDKGLDFYFEDLENLSYEEVEQIEKDIKAIISTEALEKESSLSLVLDFYMKNIYYKIVDGLWEVGDMYAIGLMESELKYDEVQKFLLKLIYSLHKPIGTSYIKQRELYNNDKELLASIRDFGLEPEQFWFLLQFCKYDVISQTKNLDKAYPSIKEDLEMLMNEIAKMEFDDKDWRVSLPRTNGELIIKVGSNEQHKIFHHTTLHLLYIIIKEYLDRKHDHDTDIHLNLHELQKSNNLIRYLYCMRNKSKLSIEEKNFYDSYNPFFNEDYRETKYNSKSSMRIIALFTYYIEQFLKEREVQKQDKKKYVYEYYPDYNPAVGINHSKLFLISKLLYIMGADIHGIEMSKRHKLYDDSHYLKDCLRGYRIKDQKGVEDCLACIRKEGIQQ